MPSPSGRSRDGARATRIRSGKSTWNFGTWMILRRSPATKEKSARSAPWSPGRGIFFFLRLGDHGAERADFSFVAGERLNIIHVPKFHVLFPLRILVALAPSLDLPEGEGIFERLVLLLLEHQQAAVAVVVELGHHRPIGIEGIADDGVDEPSVGLVQGIDQTPPGGQFAFMALMLGVDIAESFLVEHWFDPQHRSEERRVGKEYSCRKLIE